MRCTRCGTFQPRLNVEWTLRAYSYKTESVEGVAMTHGCLCNGSDREGRECFENAVACCEQTKDIYVYDEGGDANPTEETPDWAYEGGYSDDYPEWETDETNIYCVHCNYQRAQLEVVEVPDTIELDPREVVVVGNRLHDVLERHVKVMGGQSEAEALLAELNQMVEARSNR